MSPRLTPEEHAIKKLQNQVRAIDVRVELMLAERAQYMKLIGEMERRSVRSADGKLTYTANVETK
jgi:chorismate mutase